MDNDKEVKKQDKKEEKKDKSESKAKNQKKEPKKEDLKAKANNLLLKHPEIVNNARHLFRNENGTTIVQELVPRGDAKPSDIQVQGDIQDMDLRGLAIHAKSLLNDHLLRYDKKVAFEDALWNAIKTKDNGKYQGKVNASTFDLILSYLEGMKTAKELDKKQYQIGDKEESPVEVKPPKQKLDKKPEEESKPEIQEPKKVVQVTEVTKKIMTPGQEEALKGETLKGETPEHVSETDKRKFQQFQDREQKKDQDQKEDKSKSDKEANNGRIDMEKELVLKTVVAMEAQISELKKSLESSDVTPEEKKEEKKEEEKKPTEVDAGVQSILDSLDKLAGQLEETQQVELLKVAYSIDAIADVLEGKRTAATLESDLDEEYMKKYFKGGLREGDADEKSYMSEFNSDLTTQVEQAQVQLAKGKNGIKLASDRPYVILKD
jgi:hypothetical protein